MSNSLTVEICAGDLESALAAGAGRAHRVELCADLDVGGTTPSAGAIAEACRHLNIPVHVLIRPRAGDFVPSQAELTAMKLDIVTAKMLGAAGVVFGVLRLDGTIDTDSAARLVALARPMSVTFHKAFDVARDLHEALDALIALGVDRVLTSGGKNTAIEGSTHLRRLVAQAQGRIAVMAGGQLKAEDLQTLVTTTGVREVHLGSAVADASAATGNRVHARKVRAIVDLAARIDSDLPVKTP